MAANEADVVDSLYREQKEIDRVRAIELENETLKRVVQQLHDTIQKERNVHDKDSKQKSRELREERGTVKALLAEKSELEKSLRAEIGQLEEKLRSETETSAQRAQSLSDELEATRRTLAGLQSFMEMRDRLEADLRALETRLQEQAKAFAEELAELKRRHLMEKSRLRHEMMSKIREAKSSLLAMTEDQLHTTTKRTILENQQMATELHYQSKETERLLRRNDQLVAENKALKQQLELQEQAKAMLTQRTHFFQKLVKKLSERGGEGGLDGEGEGSGGMEGKEAVLPQVHSRSRARGGIAPVPRRLPPASASVSDYSPAVPGSGSNVLALTDAGEASPRVGGPAASADRSRRKERGSGSTAGAGAGAAASGVATAALRPHYSTRQARVARAAIT